MKTVLHKANTRGQADLGWLNSHHTFSFANYYNPGRTNFGVLRVLNDDIVQGGMGFGAHPHDNMEIVSIPLKGSLEHRDNTCRHEIIKTNDVQIMSAGTGIVHSEFNASKEELVNFLQVWVFPKVRNVNPRYEQKTFDEVQRENKLLAVISPENGNGSVHINQDAWFHLGNLKQNFKTDYKLHAKENGVYAFVIDVDVTIIDQQFNKRVGFGFWDTDSITIGADTNAELLLIEVPMTEKRTS
jgi:redox-sensitive bicupin YhaK (pirin superfamily)